MRCRIVSSKEVYKEGRFDGSYHNAESIVYDNVIKAHSSHNLAYYCSDIYTSGRNKRAYTTAEFGYPFLSNSDASSQNPFATCKYSSKKYGYDESSVLKSGMILTGRVGAIGQTSIVPSFWEKRKAMGSDNIIRIAVKPECKNGLIYAYLASKIGNLAFWKYATGGVQPFITDAMVGKLPIPDFDLAIQERVDQLIQNSLHNKELAAESINNAVEMLNEFCDISFSKSKGVKSSVVRASSIKNSFNTRFDPPVFINDGVTALSSTRSFKLLKDCDIKMWYPGIFKRAYVKNGYPYIKGSSMFDANPFKSCDQLSKTRTPGLDELWLKEGMVLISCAGICGQAKIITKEYSEKHAIGSPDIIRLISNDELFTAEYLYAYFQLPYVYDYLQSLKYGSVIERFDIYNLDFLPVITPTDEISKKVTQLVKEYMDYSYKAYKLEEEAISVIESVVNSWLKQ